MEGKVASVEEAVEVPKVLELGVMAAPSAAAAGLVVSKMLLLAQPLKEEMEALAAAAVGLVRMDLQIPVSGELEGMEVLELEAEVLELTERQELGALAEEMEPHQLRWEAVELQWDPIFSLKMVRI
jgi:hypothetical protein